MAETYDPSLEHITDTVGQDKTQPDKACNALMLLGHAVWRTRRAVRETLPSWRGDNAASRGYGAPVRCRAEPAGHCTQSPSRWIHAGSAPASHSLQSAPA